MAVGFSAARAQNVRFKPPVAQSSFGQRKSCSNCSKRNRRKREREKSKSRSFANTYSLSLRRPPQAFATSVPVVRVRLCVRVFACLSPRLPLRVSETVRPSVSVSESCDANCVSKRKQIVHTLQLAN